MRCGLIKTLQGFCDFYDVDVVCFIDPKPVVNMLVIKNSVTIRVVLVSWNWPRRIRKRLMKRSTLICKY